jgi:hypothetical protein
MRSDHLSKHVKTHNNNTTTTTKQQVGGTSPLQHIKRELQIN